MTAMRIEKMLYGGTGATVTGTAIPYVLPNELVELNPANDLRILESSPDRTAPGCIHFGTCGGCHYQHATYPAQLAIKRSILADTLTAAGLTELPSIETHAAEPWHYRNRIRLRVGEVDGEIRVGYNRHNATGGDPLMPISMCPIATPLLWHVASTLLGLAKLEPAIQAWLAAAVELELFTNAEETALQLTLFTRQPSTANFPAFCIAMQRAVPQLLGAGVAILPRKASPQGRRSEHPKPGPQWGAPGMIYKVDEDNPWVSRGAFFQANRHLVSRLVQIVVPVLIKRDVHALAWDLYAGVGLFSRALADQFEQVIAVEAGEPAAADLAAGLKGKNHSTFAATTLEFIQSAVVQRERPDLIVMDPPRAGVGAEVCALLARIRCPQVVYVSCDPVTLARDLKLLTASGYRITALHLVDMFPQTFHMETVAILQR